MKTFQSHHYNFMILFSGPCQDGLYVLSLLAGGLFPIRYLHSYLRFWRLIILCTFLFLPNSSWISMKKPGERKASYIELIYKTDKHKFYNQKLFFYLFKYLHDGLSFLYKTKIFWFQTQSCQFRLMNHLLQKHFNHSNST